MTDAEEAGPRFDQSGQEVESQINAGAFIVVNQVSHNAHATPTPPRKLTPLTTGLLAAGITLVVACCVVPCAVWIIGWTISGDDNDGGPSGTANSTRSPSVSTTPVTSPVATITASAYPDGVTYECTGSAPRIEINYGPSGSGTQATKLPFTAHEGVDSAVSYYRIMAQLNGNGHVTCMLTVTQAGQTTTKSGTARGGYNSASAQICRISDRWVPCG